MSANWQTHIKWAGAETFEFLVGSFQETSEGCVARTIWAGTCSHVGRSGHQRLLSNIARFLFFLSHFACDEWPRQSARVHVRAACNRHPGLAIAD